MVQIMIVEDQTMMREALKVSLSAIEGFKVAATLSDAALADLYCEKMEIDLALMDVCTENDSSGLDAAAQIKANHPSVRVLMMTGLPEVTFIDRAKKAGADGFIYKNTGIDELASVIRDVCAGKSVYPMQQPPETLNPADLTEREREILRLICDGMTRREIAEKLCITLNSVKTHFGNILSKTGYESVSKLAIFAVSHGYINPKI